MSIAYLASPYSSNNPSTTESRIKNFCVVDGLLQISGIFTVSPLYKHLLFLNGVDLPGDWDYWKDYSINLISKCSVVIVIQMEGWQQSAGVTAEIQYATSISIPVVYIDPTLSNIADVVKQVKGFSK